MNIRNVNIFAWNLPTQRFKKIEKGLQRPLATNLAGLTFYKALHQLYKCKPLYKRNSEHSRKASSRPKYMGVLWKFYCQKLPVVQWNNGIKDGMTCRISILSSLIFPFHLLPSYYIQFQFAYIFKYFFRIFLLFPKILTFSASF